MSKFEYIQGRKSHDDKIMLFNDLPVKFIDVAKMCIFFMNNEDKLYPPSKGYKGAEMFKQYIYETLKTRKIPQSSKYQIKKTQNEGLNK